MQADRKDIDSVKQAIIDSRSHTYSKEIAKEYARKAADTAAKLRDISGTNPEAIDYIQGIAEYMVIREV